MSLDVYLVMKGSTGNNEGSGIFVREDGQTKEISRDEWNEKFPGREPIILAVRDDETVYDANITHNLNSMAEEAGIYKHLWRPEEVGIKKACQLIVPLKDGLALLKSDSSRFEELNPSNGWGSYDGLVRFVDDYLQACIKYPQADVSVSG